MYELIRKILFNLPPEFAHKIVLETLKIAYDLKLFKAISLVNPTTVMGLEFPNPIGLAAGLDKNGDYIEALAALGFGFIEIGTVTPKPQAGNPKPRLFRLQNEEALINRLGFNNKGLKYVVKRLQKSRYKGLLGINIGKNASTPLSVATDDYVLGFRSVAPYASYVTINISSPNTTGLRELQHGELLKNLLAALKHEQSLQTRYVPLVVKIAPDMTASELQQMAEVFLQMQVDGVIATNTTISRVGVGHSPYAAESGGLSGKPLAHRSTSVIRELNQHLKGRIPIIGCGGVSNLATANEKFSAGASLLQLYTGLIYQGPKLIKEIADIHPDIIGA